MRVRLTGRVNRRGGVDEPGTVLDLHDAAAERLIAIGYAEIVVDRSEPAEHVAVAAPEPPHVAPLPSTLPPPPEDYAPAHEPAPEPTVEQPVKKRRRRRGR